MTRPVENACGTCTMCCKIMAIGDTFRGEPFAKAHGVLCLHCTPGVGCRVYDDRPATCAGFRCFWLEGRSRDLPLPADLRPDRCGVVIAPTEDELVWSVHVYPHRPEAWRSPTVYPWIERAVLAGARVVITRDSSTVKLLLLRSSNGRVREVYRRFTKIDERGMQYHVPGPAGTVTDAERRAAD